MYPKTLKKGSHVRIISTARKIGREPILLAEKLLMSWGLIVSFGRHLFDEDNQFAGTTESRVHDLQTALDDPTIDMVWFARGGYGTVSLLDSLNFEAFKRQPKWLVGYSDLTGLLCHVDNLHISSIHGPMPVNIKEPLAMEVSINMEHLKKWLFGKNLAYDMPMHPLNKPGNCAGEIIGGNLSILYSVLGSNSSPRTENRILFLEDLDEYLYHIDRMMLNMFRNGKLNNLSGLIVGGMSDMNDNDIPFGRSAEEIIYDYVKAFDYPVYFGFPAGHEALNLPLIFGVPASLTNGKLNISRHDRG